tara:strand:- start:389 stop:1384 length:996 start_codon:yes stop_codon:yes gene_type:complete
MIVKLFEINKIDFEKNHFYFFYGENNGHKNEIIREKISKNFSGEIHRYDEHEILNNKNSFFNTILNTSFFENKKLIIISRPSDKIKEIVEEIIERKIKDLTLVINSAGLDKKSKLRNFFEKSIETICIAFYEDNDQSLSKIIDHFLKEQKMKVSQEIINLIITRCRGDRQNLNNELEKIKSFIITNKKIEIDDIFKLTNLAENHEVSELIDQCLAKNKRKTLNILNENNYNLDDCILVIRTFLNKAKRLLILSEEIKNNKNVDSVISSIRPPIFWKDKGIVKQQLTKWTYNGVENLIFNINQTELLIKQNSSNSINILSNFIIEQCSATNN